ncbi:MAG: DNA replication/repair protein RecF [Oscillospiraceae bacterium]|nr:DNA replication/repair protein RecF [Oscillospiraceae bacterium]
MNDDMINDRNKDMGRKNGNDMGRSMGRRDSVRVEKLSLVNFRNFEKEAVRFFPGVNIICGNNAQGKTSLLEAVFFLGAGKSCRTARERDMIRIGQKEGRVEACFTSEGRAQTVEASIYKQQRRLFFINGIKLNTPRELLGRMPCVFFGASQLDIVREGAAARRRFMDIALCQLKPRYLSHLAEFNRLLAHKKRILEDAAQGAAMADVLPDFNRRIAKIASRVVAYRASFVAKVAAMASVFHREATGGRENITLNYLTRPAFEEGTTEEDHEGMLYHALKKMEMSERAALRCLVGPHLDDIAILIDNAEARKYGSQGQTRTAALAMVLAERQIFKEEFGSFPILLLDDVLSELDAARQAFVLQRTGEGQVIITCCNTDILSTWKEGRVIHIENGGVVHVSASGT